MKNTTLCYVEQGGRCLMLHRIKKAHDENEGKWIGVGGKCEESESPEDCLLREVREETGLTLTNWLYRGLVTFVSDVWPTEYMHLFTSDAFTGTLAAQCDEGELAWVEKSAVPASAGLGKRRSEAAVITPSVPSAPISKWRRS